MKRYINYLLGLSILIGFAACEDIFEEAPVMNAEALKKAEQGFPANNSNLILNAGTPDEAIEFSWQPAKAGLGSEVTYYVLFDKSGGDFNSPLGKVKSNNEGKATKLSITHQQLNEIVKSAGTVDFSWKVESVVNQLPNSTVTTSSFPYNLSITPFGVGISKFGYLNPAINQKLLLDKINTPNAQLVFDWEDATATDNSAVTYTFLAGTTPNFTEAVIEVAADNNGATSKKTYTHREFIELLSTIEYTDGLYWRVEAKSGDFTYAPETRFVWFEIFDVPTLYVLGSGITGNGDGWANNDTNPIELNKIQDGVFSSIVKLYGNNEIKFIMTKGSWDVNWGIQDQGGQAITVGTAYQLVPGGSNIKIPTTGNYIITVNFIEGTVKLEAFNPPANLYLVGGSTPANWNPANSVPFKRKSEGVFELFTYLTADGGGMKFLEVQDWAGDWGMKKGAAGKLAQTDEDNVPVAANGFYRILVDFANQSYSVEESNWGIIGDATPGGWTTDTDMAAPSALGEYTWTLTTDLTAGEFKFRANDGWDINFGDNGGDKSLEPGGTNIAVPTAGNYTITMTLDPVNGYTYTLQKN